MLSIAQSNRVDALADALAQSLREPRGAALEPETVIVQSSGMARWLSLALAERLGIAANIRFPFPAGFVWTLIGDVLPDVPRSSPFDPEVLTWRLMALLAGPQGRAHARLAHYLADGDARKRHELARRLAQSFDRYLTYRPDWIDAWSAGKSLGLGADEPWQAELWRALAADLPAAAREHPRERFFAALSRDAAARERLPSRVHLFAVQAMPPAYLDDFRRLAAHIDVRAYALNPCREYWGDIIKRRELARQTVENEAQAGFAEVGNSLLASLGRHGRAFFDALTELHADERAAFMPPATDTLLGMLQADILDLREHGSAAVPRAMIASDDRSLALHVCHGPMRETEVLHDQLLDAFERDPALRPSDVLVLVPQLEAYAPSIDAVFAAASRETRIPYTIADRGVALESGVVRAFVALLGVRETRMEAESVLALLEHGPIARRFGIEGDDLALVRQWVNETGIRWGRDERTRAALDLPATREHSWRAGFERLLLGYALPGDGRVLFGDVLPYDDVEGGTAALIGRLQTFVDAIAALDAELARARPLEAWKSFAERLLAELFVFDETQEREAQAIRTAVTTLAASARRAGFGEAVPVDVWQRELAELLQPPARTHAFLAGGVTFAALLPMRPVPARFVALLGMNDGVYPGSGRMPGFDLVAAHPRRGDRVRRDEERYAFLEALLSARERLHISYVGRDMRDNSELPPSVLVSELVDAVKRGFSDERGGDVVQRITVEHPLQPFSRRYFERAREDERLFSYSSLYAAASRAAGVGERTTRPFIEQPLAPPAEVWRDTTLEGLLRFLVNPARFFLRERLGVWLQAEEEAVQDAEPFALDGLDAAILRREAFEHCLGGASRDEALRVARAAGRLPHGSAGDIAFAALMDEIEPLLAEVRAAPRDEAREISLDLAPHRFTGVVQGVGEDGRLAWHPGKLTVRALLEAWLAHLALNASGTMCTSRLSCIDKQVRFAPVEDAAAHLHALIELMLQGWRAPLPFFPRSARAYAQARASGKGDPLARAQAEWLGNEHLPGEGGDSHFALAFRGVGDPLDARFESIAWVVFGPLLEAIHDDA